MNRQTKADKSEIELAHFGKARGRKASRWLSLAFFVTGFAAMMISCQQSFHLDMPKAPASGGTSGSTGGSSKQTNAVSLSGLTQNDITVTFDKTYTAGQYITGDYWIVDPGSGVTIASTSHVSVAGVNSGESLTKNPAWQAHAYDTRDPYYNASYKLSLPGVLHAGDSVVVATSDTSVQNQAYLYSAVIITIVDTMQSSTKFRPPYCRPSRAPVSASDPLLFDYSSITSAKWAELPSKPFTSISGYPAITATQAAARGPWLDNDGSWQAAYCHPSNQQQGYGREFSAQVSEICAQLSLAYSLADLQLLSTYVIQAGIDNYGCVLAGGNWPAAGGHGSGRKILVMFAAEMLGSSTIAAVSRTGNNSGTTFFTFGEDGQTYLYNDSSIAPPYTSLPSATVTEVASSSSGSGFVPCLGVKGQIDVLNGGTGDPVLWRISDGAVGQQAVTFHENIPMSEWDPNGNDNAETKAEGYRISCTSHTWVGEAMMMLLWKNTNLINLWNHNVFFDYIYRWMTQPLAGEVAWEKANWGSDVLGAAAWSQVTGPTWIKSAYQALKSNFNYSSPYYSP